MISERRYHSSIAGTHSKTGIIQADLNQDQTHISVMNKHKKDHKEDEPLHIHLGDDDDEMSITTARQMMPKYMMPENMMMADVEVIRPHSHNGIQARKADNIYTRGRGLRDLPAVDEEEELPPSKTKIKKQMHELRDLGKELTELGKDQLAQLDIPESLRDALREMKNINKFGAQRRQIQYIGKLMREIDPAPISGQA